jgi:hypothetical protein
LKLQTASSLKVPCFPDFIPLNIELRDALHPRLSLTFDGVSEFTFAGLYLFRDRYNYHISRSGEDGGFIISGTQPAGEKQGKKFFMTPCSAPDDEILQALFKTHDYWKNISETVLSPVREKLQELGIIVSEDRDNFDYLYFRSNIAEL